VLVWNLGLPGVGLWQGSSVVRMRIFVVNRRT
jgi:hypothetical protein